MREQRRVCVINVRSPISANPSQPISVEFARTQGPTRRHKLTWASVKRLDAVLTKALEDSDSDVDVTLLGERIVVMMWFNMHSTQRKLGV